MTAIPPKGIFERLTSVCKRLSHLEKERTMVRSAAAVAALLILPSFAPPPALAQGQEGSHEVVKGETLWALAERYLGNPYRWPLIYEANQDRIQDPHWIYPGQVFVIPGLPAPAQQPATVTEVAVVEPGAPAPSPQPAPATDLAPCPGPEGRTVFYAGGEEERGCVLVRPEADDRTAFFPDPQAAGGGVLSAEESRWPAVPRGLVYSSEWLEPWGAEIPSLGTLHRLADISTDRTVRDRARSFERIQVRPAEGVELQVGDVLQSFRILRSQEDLGQVVDPTGILTVTAVEEGGVVAAVAGEFGRMSLGDRIRPVPTYDLQPGVHPIQVESNVVATVLGFPEHREMHGFGALAFLDVGEDEGIAIGDEFDGFVNRDQGFSGEMAVRLQVVLVHGQSSTARVITLNEPILETGTRVQLVRKMR